MTLDDPLQAAPIGVIEASTDGRVVDINETAATTARGRWRDGCGDGSRVQSSDTADSRFRRGVPKWPRRSPHRQTTDGTADRLPVGVLRLTTRKYVRRGCGHARHCRFDAAVSPPTGRTGTRRHVLRDEPWVTPHRWLGRNVVVACRWASPRG